MIAETSRERAWIRDRLIEPLEELPEAAVIATNLAGRVAFWNLGAEQLYGWCEEEALGRDILELTPATYTLSQSEQIMAALQEGRRWQGEIVLRHRDGSPLSAFVVDIPVGDFSSGQGVIVGLSLPSDRKDTVEAVSASVCSTLERRFAAV